MLGEQRRDLRHQLRGEGASCQRRNFNYLNLVRSALPGTREGNAALPAGSVGDE
jgi:hypothetical protein